MLILLIFLKSKRTLEEIAIDFENVFVERETQNCL